MGRRVDLQTLLEQCLGSMNVYFQPPPTTRMKYPCIVYSLDSMDTDFGDNNPYRIMKRYQITYIDRDPDSIMLDKIAALPMCTYQRHFASDDLNHDIYNMYF